MVNIISETYRYTHTATSTPTACPFNDVTQLASTVFCLTTEWLFEKASERGHIKKNI